MKKKTLIVVVLVLIICIIVSLFCLGIKFLFNEETEEIAISNNYVYVVRHKVPIKSIENYKDLFTLLFIDFIFFHQIEPTLEKFDLNTGALIERKNKSMVFHNGYIEGNNLIDEKTNPDKIGIYALDNMTLSEFGIKEKERVFYDSSKQLFYAKQGKKLIELKKNGNELNEIKIPKETSFDILSIDDGLILLGSLNKQGDNLIDLQIYDKYKNTFKSIVLDNDWSIIGQKKLKLLGYKLRSSEFFLIELIEKDNDFQIKSIQKLHQSISHFDSFEWDKKNNKFYFYDIGIALFKNSFDLYQYDDSTLEQKIIHVDLKR